MRTTTPIDKAPDACAALWAPYGVTKVPPPDILAQEHVPPAPRVVNRTNGAVSDAEAQRWAEAGNRDSGWVKWAHANAQPFLLGRLLGPALISPAEQQALEQRATIDDPDCELFPDSVTLFPVGADGQAYFAQKRLPTDDSYVLVAAFNQPCPGSYATYPDGHKQLIFPASGGANTVFAPGVLRSDPLLGDIWFTDAGGNCGDPAGTPQEWCGR